LIPVRLSSEEVTVMSEYELVVRSTYTGTNKAIHLAGSIALSLILEGQSVRAKGDVVEVREAATHLVVARWDDGPDMTGAAVWAPDLQAKLDDLGLDAFCEEYGLTQLAPGGVGKEAVPEPDIDEDELDRLWRETGLET
jgi:hypothetical protein